LKLKPWCFARDADLVRSCCILIRPSLLESGQWGLASLYLLVRRFTHEVKLRMQVSASQYEAPSSKSKGTQYSGITPASCIDLKPLNVQPDHTVHDGASFIPQRTHRSALLHPCKT
jgi:hypothetical protein